MSQHSRGDSLREWLTHPEGNVQNDKIFTDSMERGDMNPEKHSLRLVF